MMRTTQGLSSSRAWRRGSVLLLAIGTAAGTLCLYPTDAPAGAAFPGKNGKIVFDRYLGGSGPTERKGVFTVDPRTKRLHRLIGADAREPSWSADGRKIAFVRRVQGPGGAVEDDIYTVNANGTHLFRVTRTKAIEYDPSWSPTGAWIVFARSAPPPEGQPPGPPDLYKMRANGTGLRRLTHNPDGDAGPVWSPDGKKIAFWRYSGGVFSMNPDGSGKRELTANGGGPAWSPDGRQIAFQRQAVRSDKIFVMTRTGRHVRRLGPKADLGAVSPAWSPDGRQIAFVGQSKPGVTLGIYRMTANGTNPVRLTVAGKSGDYGASDSAPDWQPLRR